MSPEFCEEANGEGMVFPSFGVPPFCFLFLTNQTAITRRLSTTNPTTIPIATAPPVPKPLPLLDEVFAATSPSPVGFAVGFSVGMAGNGELLGLPGVDGMLLGGAGGETAGGEEGEGVEADGGEDAGSGGEFKLLTGGGVD